VAVPLMIRISRATGMMAVPGERHPHLRPTPLLGGLALYLGFAAAVLIFLPDYEATAGVLVVSGLAAVLLIADDRWHVRATIKFVLQMVVALVAILVYGFKITSFGLPGDYVIGGVAGDSHRSSGCWAYPGTRSTSSTGWTAWRRGWSSSSR
jgi:UDP-GlcNAc:undecaprenyl-phosphate GlcNAc-1-phosphate transferase